MEFSAWSWASYFRLHEAACLIAGVVPISKRNPATDELPSQARPPLIKLVGSYYEWFLQAKNPERPKSIALEGILNDDGSMPPFPALNEVSGEIVSRAAIHRFVSLMAEHGFKSCYDFGPIGKAGSPHEVGHQAQAATPTPVVSRGTPRALTNEQEIEIVRLYDRSRGASVNSLAKRFGVSNPTIDKVLKRAGIKK